jgi:AcrR family transcriptional regulator
MRLELRRAMARPKSDERRSAIMAAAVRVIASQGLSAPTAAMAKEAGVSSGSLFTYFDTKAELFNALYLALKEEMAATALQGLPVESDVRAQMFQIWRNWVRWTAAFPDKRKALAQLTVSDDITPATRDAAQRATAGMAAFIERSRKDGPMANVPLAFVGSLMNGIAESTIDYMIADPAHADEHCVCGFDALWRVIA